MPETEPVSPFLTFAEILAHFDAERHYECEHAGTEGACSSRVGCLITREEKKQAERHARLLAQIETWVNETTSTPGLLFDDAKRQGIIWAKAHIKALLEQS